MPTRARIKRLTIKDNSLNNKEDFSKIQNLTAQVADKTLEQLEKEGVFIFPELLDNSGDHDLEKDQIVLRSDNNCYRTGNVMGFLGYGKERLVIHSRFCESTDKNAGDYFFRYLLEEVLDVPNLLDLNINADTGNTGLDLLPFLFPYELKSTLRKGLFKKYVHRQYNNGNYKGTIDVPRHIKTNTPFVGKFAYNCREFSYDNSLMELIRHTLEYIKSKPYGKRLLAKIKDEVNLVKSVTTSYKIQDRQKVIIENKKTPVRHAYFREYRALQRLCLLILQHKKSQINSGTGNINGILFDGAWLWEEYVNKVIKDRFHHPMNKARHHTQSLFSHDGKIYPDVKIYPDYISKNAKKRIIADAKYKPNKNISNSDYFQILAYMFRFDAKSGFFLYPDAEENPVFTLQLNSGSTFEDNVTSKDDISVIKCGLKIPANAESYDDFSEKIKQSEKEFKMVIDAKLPIEE